jgi:hypothetical protein
MASSFKDKKGRINRSGSMYVEPRISEQVLIKSGKLMKSDESLFLKERGILRYMIQSGELE